MPRRGAPSLANGHWFGVDEPGRGLFARTVQGTRISLMAGVVGALIVVIVGILYGAVAGYSGRLDSVMMRIVDVLMSVPYMFVLILFMVVFGGSIVMLFIGTGLTSWLDMARIARGQTLSIKGREFVEAAVTMSVRPGTIHAVNGAEVVVLYGGRVMESGPVERVFAAPRHPYTQGLLEAVPRLDRDDESLPAIPGDPPSMSRLPAGCPFAARCPRTEERCLRGRPELEVHAPNRRVSCHRLLEDVR